jgi:hypothetical protein
MDTNGRNSRCQRWVKLEMGRAKRTVKTERKANITQCRKRENARWYGRNSSEDQVIQGLTGQGQDFGFLLHTVTRY